jgi:membrane-bound lytic murein transglycosylase D
MTRKKSRPAALMQAVKVLGLLAFLLPVGVARPCAADDPFPMPEVIAPNVAFWTKVYTQYTTRQGIVHDNVDLGIIYDVIGLVPYDAPGASEINRKRMRQANENYQRILQRLARNPGDTDRASRRVARLWGEPRDAETFLGAAGRVRCQTGQKDRFEAGLVRSGAYMDAILAIFQSYGLPADLAYLPHVESSFNPHAYSKFGAAGIWQFMPATGRRYMEVGYTLDERRDPIAATHAAAQLLLENHATLGDWPLAITAYNHGTAGMERAKQAYGDYASIFQHYQGRGFRFASRNFYAEFLAARQVASSYREYFGELAFDRPPPTYTVVLEGYAAFDDLSAHFKVAPQTLKQMNLALRPPVIDGQKLVPKGYALRLPGKPDLYDIGLWATVPAALYHTAQRPSRFHTVQRGDTVGKIARIHGVQVADLILANNLDRRATIYPRQTLRIPGPADPQPVLVASIGQPGVAVQPEPIEPHRDSPQPAAAPGPSEAPLPPPVEAVDPPTPMLASIVPLPLNDGAGEADRLNAAGFLSARNEQIVALDIGFERFLHTRGGPAGIIRVEVEETLGHYAEWAGVRAGRIRALNGLDRDSALQLHQRIQIPLQEVDAEAFEQSRYEFHKRLQEDFFAVYRIGELQTYRVRPGETYWNLCQEKFQIPMWLLKHCNPDADLADLRFNQTLIVPTIEKVSADDADPGIGKGFETETGPQGDDGV